MNLKELATPIRLYWDIGPEAGIGHAGYQRIASEVTANRFLSLQITDTSPGLGEATFTVLEALAGKPLALSLVLSQPSVDEQDLDRIRRFPLKALFLTTQSIAEIEKAVHLLREKTAIGPDIGISYAVTRANYEDLPAVLSRCVEEGIPHLLLPMQRLVNGEECFWLTTEEQEGLSERLLRIHRPNDLKITIHDPFLWKAFYPFVDFPGGGCQAANTMLYISTGADVYPCPMMPVKLGNLLQSSLKDVILSGYKREIRERIVAAAQRCGECEELRTCRGGCRGRVLSVHSSFHEPDPACSYGSRRTGH